MKIFNEMEKIIKQQVDNSQSSDLQPYNSVNKGRRNRGRRDSQSSNNESRELSASRITGTANVPNPGRKSPFDNQKKIVPKPNVRDRSKTPDDNKFLQIDDDVLSLIDDNETGNSGPSESQKSKSKNRSVSGARKRSTSPY
jgi:hypothetical protein